ncbi:hypothetical protein E3P89_04045 [Wallemia ichthyophaga]|uniref:Uncharacterized protein n=1 Tax=Wallemia ichthyophaga TaxID=245174 RepID=A0A4T0IIN3_WALIC|nr:hypothetical protein E3P98_04074 [Wallemia ichthyophaga]TIA87045.1 hypothetical protein E3P97_04086 [Wallemia ichthyophaga]TIA94758.1 hypothetical protein E3P95_04087 [Wallemia ichthyophaga]TIA95337.1 hypothetical protein E3P94_04087 [Wallemia ichthyophaga]TIA96725.1 hypothetical protein E3P96_03542 [Wallemia ichthyophaga]
MSVLDHPIEFLPTSIDKDKYENIQMPKRRLKRLSLLSGGSSDAESLISLSRPSNDSSNAPITQPMTLFDQHAPLLSRIAHKETIINDLQDELDMHTVELKRLRKDWRRVVRNQKRDNLDELGHPVYTDHSEEPTPTTQTPQPNAYLQHSVDLLVDGVGAFWDTLRSGPGLQPNGR